MIKQEMKKICVEKDDEKDVCGSCVKFTRYLSVGSLINLWKFMSEFLEHKCMQYNSSSALCNLTKADP